jgi:apolipoprotein N-acyltransferase
MPGIPYPHGQPCHAFWSWPVVLGPVRLGGDPLGNALLGVHAAAAVVLARAWRTGVPGFRATRRGVALLLLATALAAFVSAPAPRSESAPTVAIAAIEPDLHPLDAFAGIPPGDTGAAMQRWREILHERLLEPTHVVAGRTVAAPPDLVLWPESSVPYTVRSRADGSFVFDGMRGALQLSRDVRVCLGADRLRRDGRSTPAAVLVAADGTFVAHQEKQRLVPAGEFLPFVDWLPEAWAESVRRFAQTTVGVPDCVPGERRPLLRLTSGVPFAAMICYDNAFPGVAAAAVADGARFLAVLSNEAWYRGGGERDQLAAISVLRAVALEVPIVRCTTDGLSFAVDRDGAVLAALPAAAAPLPASRVLAVDLPLGDGRLPPLARVHPWLGWTAALWVVLACMQAMLPWDRLLRPRRTSAGS